MDRCSPKLKAIITTDSGLAIFIFLPAFMVIAVLLGLLVQDNYSLNANDVFQLAALLGVFLMLISPMIIWWVFVIKRMFVNGIECKGEVVEYFNSIYFSTEIALNIICDNELIEKKLVYVSNKRVKDAAQKKNVTVITNTKKTIFFIKEAFVGE